METRRRGLLLLAVLMSLVACRSYEARWLDDRSGEASWREGEDWSVEFRVYGSLQEQFERGALGGRVDVLTLVDELSKPGGAKRVFCVGVLEGGRGIVTVVRGRSYVSTVDSSTGEPVTRPARPGDESAWLVAARVPKWYGLEVGPIRGYAELEARIAEELSSRGFDLSEPTPIWLRGSASSIRGDVVDRGSPSDGELRFVEVAFQEPSERLDVVGVFVRGEAGSMKPENSAGSFHVLADGRAARLEDLDFTGGTLAFPSTFRMPESVR
ncbi:MAG: hypothetical protein AAF196_07065 [Planctomycetota bacterium]